MERESPNSRVPENHGLAERSSSRAQLTAAIASLFLVAASCTPMEPSPSRADDGIRAADSIVREWVETERIPGAVLLISRGGDVVFEEAYGWAQLYEYRDGQYGASAAGESRPSAMQRLAEPVPMTTETVFDLASITKVMATTFAVMLLVDSGELDLDAPVSTYLPDFVDNATAAAPRPSGAGKDAITVRHLLTHRAGLFPWKPTYYHADDAEQAYAYIRDLPLSWSPGAERHYSDLGFMLLGRVVERASGRPLGAFLDEHLYGPLALRAIEFRPHTPGDTSTSQDAPASGTAQRPAGEPGVAARFAATSHGNPYEHRMVHDPDFGYRIDGNPDAWDGWRDYTLAGEVNDGNAFHAFEGEAGHAGLFSTAAELQVLLQLLLNRGEYGGRRYVSADVVDTFLASTGDGQALGWQVPDDAPAGSFSHTGFTGTYVLGVPAEGVALVLLTNRQNPGVDERGQYPDVGELQRAVSALLSR